MAYLDKLWRAFFFEELGGVTIHDQFKGGSQGTLDSGIVWRPPYGVTFDGTDNVEINLTVDNATSFDFLQTGLDGPASIFVEVDWTGTPDTGDYYMYGNHTSSFTDVWDVNPVDTTIEDGKRHTYLSTMSRSQGARLYQDGIEIDSITSPASAAAVNAAIFRYRSDQDRIQFWWGSANRGDAKIGGDPISSATTWDGTIYGMLLWRRWLTAMDAMWLHHNYRLLKYSQYHQLIPQEKPERGVIPVTGWV